VIFLFHNEEGEKGEKVDSLFLEYWFKGKANLGAKESELPQVGVARFGYQGNYLNCYLKR